MLLLSNNAECRVFLLALLAGGSHVSVQTAAPAKDSVVNGYRKVIRGLENRIERPELY